MALFQRANQRFAAVLQRYHPAADVLTKLLEIGLGFPFLLNRRLQAAEAAENALYRRL